MKDQVQGQRGAGQVDGRTDGWTDKWVMVGWAGR